MQSETSRRVFLQSGTLAAAGLLATEASAALQEAQPQHEHEHAGHGRSGASRGPPRGRRAGRQCDRPGHARAGAAGGGEGTRRCHRS